MSSVDRVKTFTLFWPTFTVDAAKAAGLEGKPLEALESDGTHRTRFTRTGVKPGDTVIVMTTLGRTLYLMGALRVTGVHKARPGEAERVTGESLAPLRFDVRLPADLARRWAWSVTGRKFGPVGGDPTGIHLLAPRSATVMMKHLAAPRPEQAARTSDVVRLEKVAQQRDAKVSEARVLCDAWLEAGDARAELMSLELAIAEAPTPERAAELDAQLRAVVAEAPHLTRLAGGYPWRAKWLDRPYEVIEASYALGAKTDALLARSVVERTRRLFPDGRTWWLSLPRALSGPVLRDAGEALERFAERRQQAPRETTIEYWVRWNVEDEQLISEMPRVLAVTRDLTMRMSGELAWPGSKQVLPLTHSSTSTVRWNPITFDFGRRRVEATLNVPLPLPGVPALLRHYRDVLKGRSPRSSS
ncbi:MAG: hypothetical protein JNK82_31990 [Myxococcaceae bacterium]|nr:hypothetical protein [Myxococcaceae bacterium]